MFVESSTLLDYCFIECVKESFDLLSWDIVWTWHFSFGYHFGLKSKTSLLNWNAMLWLGEFLFKE